MRGILIAVVLACAPLSVQAQELSGLEAEYAEAFAEWEVAYEAARAAGLRSRERPAESAVVFWPRYMQALEAGEAAAALWLVEHVRDADLKGSERKLVLPRIPPAIELLQMPSTSPANAGMTFAQKLAAWRRLMEFID